MRVLATVAALAVFLTSATTLAEEYVLTIKGTSEAIRNAPSLEVFDKSLEAGDKIVRVFFGGSSFGTECVVAPGSSGEILAQKGSAVGYSGEVRLGTGTPPAGAVPAEIAPAKLGEPGAAVTGQLGQKAKEQALNAVPWGSVFLALAIVMVGFFGFKILGTRVGPAAVVGLSSVEKELRAVKDQLLAFGRGLERSPGAATDDALNDRLASIERKLDERSSIPKDSVASSPELGPLRDLLMAVVEKAERTEAAIEALREAASRSAGPQAPDAAAAQIAFEGFAQALESVAATTGSFESRLAELSAKVDALAETGARHAESAPADHELIRPMVENTVASLEAKFAESFAALTSHVEALGERLVVPHSQGSEQALPPFDLEALRAVVAESLGALEDRSAQALQEIKAALAGDAERQAAAFAGSLSTLESRLSQVTERLTSLESTFDRATSANTPATEALRSALDALAKEISHLAARAERTEAAVECLSKIAVSGDASREATPEESARWEQLLTMEAKLSGVPDTVALLREKIGELEAALASTSQRVHEFQSLVSETRAEASRENAAILDRIEEVKAAFGGAQEVKGLLDTLAHEFVGFAAKVEGMDAFMEGVRRQLEQLEALDSARFETAEARLTELANAVGESAPPRDWIEGSTARLAEIGTKIEGVGQALGSLESRLSALEARSAEDARSDPRFDRLIEAQQSSLEALRSLSDVQTSVASLVAKSDALESNLANLRATLESVGSNASGGEMRELLATQSQLAEVPHAIAALAESLAALSQRADQLEAGIAELRVAAASPKLPPEAFQPDPRIDDLLQASMAWSVMPEAMSAVSTRVEQVFAALAAAQSEIVEMRQRIESVGQREGSEADSRAAFERLEALYGSLEGVPQALEAVQQALSELNERAHKTELELGELKAAVPGPGSGSASADWDDARLETLISRISPASAPGLTPETLEKIESISSRLQAEDSKWADVQNRFESLAASIEAMRELVAGVLRHRSQEAPTRGDAEGTAAAPKASDRGGRARQPQTSTSETDAASRAVKSSSEGHVITAPTEVEDSDEAEGWDGGHPPTQEKRVMPWCWTMVGGSVERHWSSESREPISLSQGGAAPRALTPTEAPESISPIGQVLFALGHVVYSHGDKVRGFWPGKEPRMVTLTGSLPDGDWRLLVHNGQLFCAHEDRVEIVQMGTWSRGGGFKGAYFDQLYAAPHWVGLCAADGNTVVEFRSPSGDKVNGSVTLKVRPDDVRFSTAIGEDVFLATYSGKVFRCNPQTAKAIGRFAETGFDFLQLSTYEGLLLGLVQEGGAVAVRLLDPTGKKVREARLGMAEPFSNAVVMSSAMYIADNDKHEIHVLDLETMEEVDRVPVPGIAQIRRMAGLHDGQNRVLLIAGVDASAQSGKAVLFDPETAIESPVCSVGAHSKVHFIPAEGKVVVATSTSYQNIIRVFDPSSSGEGRKAA